MTWQPIESAPKDQTILVFGTWAGEINGTDNKLGIYVARWARSTDYFGYDWSVTGTDAYAAWVKPSHWMPLPEAP